MRSIHSHWSQNGCSPKILAKDIPPAAAQSRRGLMSEAANNFHDGWCVEHILFDTMGVINPRMSTSEGVNPELSWVKVEPPLSFVCESDTTHKLVYCVHPTHNLVVGPHGNKACWTNDISIRTSMVPPGDVVPMRVITHIARGAWSRGGGGGRAEYYPGQCCVVPLNGKCCFMYVCSHRGCLMLVYIYLTRLDEWAYWEGSEHEGTW